MGNKVNSQTRVLTIFLHLLRGQMLTKKELVATYNKDAVTIQRDIAYINDALEKHAEEIYFKNGQQSAMPFEEFVRQNTIQRTSKGHYQLLNFEQTTLNKAAHPLNDEDLLLILKIILASRALEHDEMMALCDKLIGLSQDQETLKKLINNEKTFYRGVPTTSQLKKIQLLCDCITQTSEIEFTYQKYGETATLTRIPQAIYFADMYLYVLTASHNAQDDADLAHLSKFRINNMNNIKIISSNNKVDHAHRFEGGMLRRQTDLPFLGNPITLVVDFFWDPVYVLDRFPDSKIISQRPGKNGAIYRIEMQVNDGYGMKMWLLGQGDMVKIISPQHMRDYVINDMCSALSYYGLTVDKKTTPPDPE